MVSTYTPWWFLWDGIFHFCHPILGTIWTMVFWISFKFVSWSKSLQHSSEVFWGYWDHGFSFNHLMGTIRTMVFCFSPLWIWPCFSKKVIDCCYFAHGFNSAGESTRLMKPRCPKNMFQTVKKVCKVCILGITQNRVMNFVYWCYEFFVSTVSFSVNGPSLCCEKQKKIETRP